MVIQANSTVASRSESGSASAQPWQAFMSVTFDLDEHMQWIVVESIDVPTSVTLLLVVWQD